MQISSTYIQPRGAARAQVSKQNAVETDNAPSDSFTFSEKSLSGKQMFQIGTIGAGAGIIGAIPAVGAVSGVMAAASNAHDDELGSLIGVASAVTNVAASVAVLGFGQTPYLMAIPALTGAISWGGYAHNAASS